MDAALDGSVWTELGSWLLELALILVLMFWVVGAYNRLMRLRQGWVVAWGQIDELLVRRSAVLEPLLAAVRDAMPDEAASLQAVVVAQERQRAAALAVRARPARGRLLADWVAAERELISPLARLNALLDQRAELADSPEVQPARKQLAELAARLQFARQAFNDAAEVFNQAATELPTRPLARLFGFRPVTRL